MPEPIEETPSLPPSTAELETALVKARDLGGDSRSVLRPPDVVEHNTHVIVDPFAPVSHMTLDASRAVELEQQFTELRARIKHLETLVAEKDSELDALRRGRP